MSTGIIDIGSASVRLLLDGKRTVVMTKLAEGLNSSGKLSEAAMRRTAEQIEKFVRTAREAGAGCVAFATEAVRAASNRTEFTGLVAKTAGLRVEIVSEFEEAEIAFLGACPDGSGTVVDIGGASVEIVSGENGNILYSKSLPLGAVRLTEKCGTPGTVASYAAAKITGYGDVRLRERLYGVGGTLTSLAAMAQNLDVYDSARVHGFELTAEALGKIAGELTELREPEKIRKRYPSLQPMRAGIITAGTVFAVQLLKYLGRGSVTVSEADNMDGYAVYRKIT